jgi:hypothetical protein
MRLIAAKLKRPAIGPWGRPEGSEPCGGRRVQSPCHAESVTTARRRPQADDPEQARPIQAVGLDAVAASIRRGAPQGPAPLLGLSYQ